MTTGERIRNTREDMDILQQELADAVEMNVSVLSRIEKGTRPIRDDELKKIARKLGVTTDYLLGNPPPPSPPHIDARTRRQLEKVLDDDNLTYNGVVLNGEDKEKVKKALELIFWDVKEKNRRKK
mgnify:FL=1